jgi:hypothetical protein
MSQKLFMLNVDCPIVAENEEMAKEIFKQKYPRAFIDIVTIKEISEVDGYRIVPVGGNINNVLEQIVLDYAKEME